MDKLKPISLQGVFALTVLAMSISGCSMFSGGGASTEKASTGAATTSAPAASDEDSEEMPKGPMVLFKDGLTSKPFEFYVGSPDNWLGDTLANEPTSGGKHGAITVEPGQIDKPNDGKKVTYRGDSQVYLQSKKKQEYDVWIDAGAALEFDLIVHTPPEGLVTVRVDCGYPCIGGVDATNAIKALPVGKKSTLKFPLSCFKRVGTNFTFVNTPWLMNTPKPFVVTVGNIRWVPGAAKDADVVKCVQ